VLLRRNLLIYGLGGIIVPFVGIKLIDMLLTMFGWSEIGTAMQTQANT
jgi:K+-transporting ATPase ATPase B chain